MSMMTLQSYYQESVNQGGRALVASESQRETAVVLPEGVQQYKLTAEHENLFDIIPFRVTSHLHPLMVSGRFEQGKEYFDDIFMYFEHRDFNDNGDAVVCPKHTWGKPCPICDLRWEQYNDNGRDWKKVNPKLREQTRVMMNVVDIRDREAGIKVMFGTEYTLRQGILSASLVNRADQYSKNNQYLNTVNTFVLEMYDKTTKTTNAKEYLYIASPTNGLTMQISAKTETFNNYAYAKATSFAVVPRTQQYALEIRDQALDLSEYLVEKTYEEIEELLYGRKHVPAAVDSAAQATTIAVQSPVSVPPVSERPMVNNSVPTPPQPAAAPVAPPVYQQTAAPSTTVAAPAPPVYNPPQNVSVDTTTAVPPVAPPPPAPPVYNQVPQQAAPVTIGVPAPEVQAAHPAAAQFTQGMAGTV